VRRLDRPGQFRLQLAQPLPGARVRLRLARVGVDDQVDAAGEVVDDRHFFRQQQQDVRHAEVVRLRMRELLLDHAHDVVAEVPREAAGEARQSRSLRDLELPGEALDGRQRIALDRLDHVTVFDDFRHRPAFANEGTDRRARRQADEGIAAEAFAAHHRLEQETVRLVGELQVQRQRGFEVREALGDQRNARVALYGQRLEFQFSHDSPL